MSGWQFWEEGIIGLVFIMMGIGNVYAFFYSFPKKLEKEGTEGQKVRKKYWIGKVGAIVFILYGILLLVGYLNW